MPTHTGYWTEGKIVDGVNVGGGKFVQGTPPTPTVSPTSPTASISSASGATTINNAIEEQKKNMASLAPPTTDTTTKPAKVDASAINILKQSGAYTEEEINVGGFSKTDFNFDGGTGLYIPKSSQADTQTSKVERQFQEDTKTYKDAFASMITGMEASTNALVNSISGIYSSRINEQREANKRELATFNTLNVRLGTDRYAPGVAVGVLVADERAGLDRIKKIALEEANLIASAQQNLQDKKYSAFIDQINQQKELRREKNEVLSKLQERAYEIQKEQRASIQEVQKELTKNLNSILVDASKNGATDEVKNAISNSKNLGEAVKAAGDYLQTGTGDVGEYLLYKREAIKNGQVPLDPLSYAGKKAQMEANKQIAIERAKAGASGLPIDFNQFSEEQIALSAIPVQLRNTEVELKRFLEGIRKGLKEGKSPYEVSDILIGYKIENPDDFSKGMRGFISIAGLDNLEISNMARLINSGNKAGAIAIVENKMMNKQKTVDPEGYVGESTSKYYASKVVEIKNVIEKAGLLDTIGPVEGSFSSVFGKVPLFKRAEAAKIQAKVTSLVAEMRNHLSGTAVTDSEKKFLEPLIASLSDKKGIFITKLDEIKDNSLLRLNQVRQSAELPTLDEQQLLNREARASLYSSSKITADSFVRDEHDLESKVIEYGKANPNVQSKISQMVTDGLTYDVITKILGL